MPATQAWNSEVNSGLMKLLCLDVSTNAGWAVLCQKEDSSVAIEARGLIQKEKTAPEYGQYPRSYRLAAKFIGEKLGKLVDEYKPDIVVVEETNQGRSRYTQKLLEWIHLELQGWWDAAWDLSETWKKLPEPVYISTGVWKSTLGLKKPADAKKNDKLLKKAKDAFAHGEFPTLNAAKKALGIRGKWNKKMLAVNYVNELYGLNLVLKDNDEAEAVCLGLAYLKGAPHCDGVVGDRE